METTSELLELALTLVHVYYLVIYINLRLTKIDGSFLKQNIKLSEEDKVEVPTVEVIDLTITWRQLTRSYKNMHATFVTNYLKFLNKRKQVRVPI